MTPPLVRMTDIHWIRDGRSILKNINWEIGVGEHWTLLGANGSGKTSLLKIMTGHEWPHEGTIDLLGERIGRTDLRELRKSIGWATNSLLSWFPETNTALEHVLSGLDASIGLWREFTPDEIRLAESSLRDIGGEAYMDRPYGVLSQGERQRVLLARAWVNRPRLLILDEPCVGLDPPAREKFLDDLTSLAKQLDAPTLILVTHHVEEIPEFMNHALILKEGKALSSGNKNEVLTSNVLSDAWGRLCEVVSSSGRYGLRWPQKRA